MVKIDISAEPATPPEAGVKVHVRKGAETALERAWELIDEMVRIREKCKNATTVNEAAGALIDIYQRAKKVREELDPEIDALLRRLRE